MLYTVALLLFPIMFLPLVGTATEYGNLGMSDYVLPFIYLALLPGLPAAIGRQGFPRRVTICFVLFVAWALASTLTIPLRFQVSDTTDYYVGFGLLKLGKFAEYAVFGYFLLPWLKDQRSINWFKLALLGGTLAMALNATWISMYVAEADVAEEGKQAILGGKNGVSTLLAMLVAYWAADLLYTKRNLLAMAGILGVVLLALAGMLICMGRGGWVAAIVAVSYLLFTVRKRPRFAARLAAFMIAMAVLTAVVITRSPAIQDRIDETLHADEHSSGQEGINPFTEVTGLDDGGRVTLFLYGLMMMSDCPVLGSGFFHRGDNTGVFIAGMHNFFTEMGLETGLVGLTLLLIILVSFWRQIGRGWPHREGNLSARIALRAAIVAVTTACFSEEYLYGGLHLLCLSAFAALTVAENRLLLRPREQELVIAGDLLAGPYMVRGT